MIESVRRKTGQPCPFYPFIKSISQEDLYDEENKVAVGDKVVTSNISDKFLPGILIGYISSIESDPNNLTKSGYITPAVDFKHMSEVLVVTEMKQATEE